MHYVHTADLSLWHLNLLNRREKKKKDGSAAAAAAPPAAAAIDTTTCIHALHTRTLYPRRPPLFPPINVAQSAKREKEGMRVSCEEWSMAIARVGTHPGM